MARLIHGVAVASAPRRADPLTDLTLLLNRLQRTILHADSEREARLRESEFEREKAKANVNYARSLLTKLEQDALAVKIHIRRQEAQADLLRKKDVLDQLSERLSDLAEFAAARQHGEGIAEEDTSDGEDLLADIIATPSESLDTTSRASDLPPDDSGERHDRESDGEPEALLPEAAVNFPQLEPQPTPSSAAPLTTAAPPPSSSTTTTSQTLRPRHTNPPFHPPTQPTTIATASTTSRSTLFHNRTASPSATPSTAAAASTAIPSTTEALLDHQRSEQDALSESILKLAADLKASSQAFSASLEEDKELVERAGKGMSKTGERMETVTRRMGVLQRMTEGEGWWGRMRLYAIVYGLMVVLVLVVGVGPKLRF